MQRQLQVDDVTSAVVLSLLAEVITVVVVSSLAEVITFVVISSLAEVVTAVVVSSLVEVWILSVVVMSSRQGDGSLSARKEGRGMGINGYIKDIFFLMIKE